MKRLGEPRSIKQRKKAKGTGFTLQSLASSVTYCNQDTMTAAHLPILTDGQALHACMRLERWIESVSMHHITSQKRCKSAKKGKKNTCCEVSSLLSSAMPTSVLAFCAFMFSASLLLRSTDVGGDGGQGVSLVLRSYDTVFGFGGYNVGVLKGRGYRLLESYQLLMPWCWFC